MKIKRLFLLLAIIFILLGVRKMLMGDLGFVFFNAIFSVISIVMYNFWSIREQKEEQE